MGIQELEAAMFGFLDLADADAAERAFHQWFLDHPIVMQLLGYARVISEPPLLSHVGEEEREDRPDFMVQRLDGLWEIFEIKRVDTDVLLPAKRRRDFYAPFRKYLSQCREYSAYFEDPANRNEFQTRYTTTIQQTRLKRVLVAGWDSEDRALVHDLIAQEQPLLDFMTYGELFARLENAWRIQEGENERLRGLSVSLRIVLARRARPGERLWIADFGEEEKSGRASLFLEDDALHVEVRDSAGVQYLMRVQTKTAFGRQSYLGFELGLHERFAVGRVWIDDQVETNRWASLRFPVVDSLAVVLGSDMTGHGRGAFLLGEYVAVKGTMALYTRIEMRRHMKSNAPATWVHFYQGALMHTRGHPCFPRYKEVLVEGQRIKVLDRQPPTTDFTTPAGDARGPIIVNAGGIPVLIERYLAQSGDDDGPVY